VENRAQQRESVANEEPARKNEEHSRHRESSESMRLKRTTSNVDTLLAAFFVGVVVGMSGLMLLLVLVLGNAEYENVSYVIRHQLGGLDV